VVLDGSARTGLTGPSREIKKSPAGTDTVPPPACAQAESA
jgi:hypothetical protein